MADQTDIRAPSLVACPACAVTPLAEASSRVDPARPGEIQLSVPGMHCGMCIATVEDALMKHPGVKEARVNLTLRRASVTAPDLTAEDLVGALDAVGYEAHELNADALSSATTDKETRDLLMRIGVAGFAMMNIMILSIAVWSGADAATRDMFHLISAIIAVPTVMFAGQPFFSNAISALRHGRLGMDVPISLALILATAMSLYETLHSGRHAYFDAAVMLCFFLLIGRYLDSRSRAVARSAAQELTALEVPRARRLSADGSESEVPVKDLRPGDLIHIRPGNRIAADGVIVEGWSEIDRALISGESIPVRAGPDTELAAGEVNLTGPLVMRVTAAGPDSSLARLTALVAAAETLRNRYTSLADRAARIYAPLVHLLAIGAFVAWWWIGGDWQKAMNVAAAVLIITCPCALGLAVPAVVTAASGRLFKAHMLVKDATALERLAEVDTVVFDKTGTLTLDAPRPIDLGALSPLDQSVAYTLARASDHPLSRSLAEGLEAAGVVPAVLDDLREVPGHGVEASLNGAPVRLGRADWVGGAGTFEDTTASWLRLGDAPAIPVRFDDHLRPGARELVERLKGLGMDVWLVSGDAPGPVARTAERLGIEDALARVSPEGKAEILEDLARQGRFALMVGDGLNDTAALAGAHVSISPASGLDAARVASDMVLMSEALNPIADAVVIARAARQRIRENFAISAAYNMVSIPIALAGFVTPLIAALAMSASSLTVTLNALRLKR